MRMKQQAGDLVQVFNVKKHFPIQRGLFGVSVGSVRAVDDVSFFIRKGETFSLVGESGSGKTTLGRTIIRAVEPTDGRILFQIGDGETVDVTTLSPQKLRSFRKHAQVIFQDPYSSLNPRMTVRDIIAEPLVATKAARGSAIEDIVRETALHCQLSIEHLRRYPHAFSGGQRQRIGIARALVLKPEFIVCDEPVSSLDVSIQSQILNLLGDLQKEYGLTYLFIAHDLSVVQNVSDRVAVMYLGRLMEMATTEGLYQFPLHPYTEALISAIPVPDPEITMSPQILSGEIPNPANPPSGCHFHPRCKYASDICAITIPEWKEYRRGHFCACHLADTLTLRGTV